MHLNDLTSEIINASIKIHKALVPGLFESVYEEVLAYELEKNGYKVIRQVAVPVYYESIKTDVGFRSDLIVEEAVIVEIKSVEKLSAVHKKQVLNYLRLTTLQVGL